MENFFQHVGRFWPAGRRDLHWHIIPTANEAIALAAPYVTGTGLIPPGLQRVSFRHIHCTLLHAVGVGITDVDMDTLLKDAWSYAQTVQPFTLTFDRPAVSNRAVEIGGWPGREFASVVKTLSAMMTNAGADFEPAPSGYPHVSVAYGADGAEAVDEVTLKATLASIAHPLSGTVVADRLHLVEQWHDGAHIKWSPIAVVPLAGAQ